MKGKTEQQTTVKKKKTSRWFSRLLRTDSDQWRPAHPPPWTRLLLKSLCRCNDSEPPLVLAVIVPLGFCHIRHREPKDFPERSEKWQQGDRRGHPGGQQTSQQQLLIFLLNIKSVTHTERCLCSCCRRLLAVCGGCCEDVWSSKHVLFFLIELSGAFWPLSVWLLCCDRVIFKLTFDTRHH